MPFRLSLRTCVLLGHTLVHEFEGNLAFARTVAKAAFIAPDPVRAARQSVRDYHAVVRELTAQGMALRIAPTIVSRVAPTRSAETFPPPRRCDRVSASAIDWGDWRSGVQV